MSIHVQYAFYEHARKEVSHGSTSDKNTGIYMESPGGADAAC